MEKSFKKGEVVWAKVRGYSWWPGIVKKITLKITKSENTSWENNSLRNLKELRILVKYIGDNSHSILPLDKIEKFEKKYSEFSKTKNKHLLHSIKLAKKLIAEEISSLDLGKNRILLSNENSNKQSGFISKDDFEDDSQKRKINDVILNQFLIFG